MGEREVVCADCSGFDVEWMRHCSKHGTDFCRGCACPECAEEAWNDYEEDGAMDLEDQLDAALGWVCECRKRNSLELSSCAACGHRKPS